MKKLILGAAFLVVGTLATAQQTMSKMQKKDPAQMEQKREDHMKKMQMDLGLSNTQVSQIQALQNKKMAEREAKRNSPEMRADRKAQMDMMKTKRDQWNSEMRTILTPDQYKKWEAHNQEKMEHRKEKMEHRGEGMQNRKMEMTPAKN